MTRDHHQIVRDFLAAEEDRVVAEFTSQGKLVTGEHYRNDYLFLFRVRDGRIASVAEYFDPGPVREKIAPSMAKAFARQRALARSAIEGGQSHEAPRLSYRHARLFSSDPGSVDADGCTTWQSRALALRAAPFASRQSQRHMADRRTRLRFSLATARLAGDAL